MDERQTTGTIARRLMLLALLGVTFVASAMVTIYVLFQAGEVKVPNIVGMSQEEAQHAIERAGLHFKLRRQHFDAETPTGQVTVQDPAPGFPVKEGFDIKVDVSKGPDPTGKDQEPAPVGPTNPVDGPVDPKKKNDKKKEDEKKKADEKKAEDGKTVKTDEPGAVKPGDADKPKPKPDDKPKPGDAKSDTPPKPRPKPAPAKVPPHD